MKSMNKNKALARSKRQERQLYRSKNGRDRDYLAKKLQQAKQEIKQLKAILKAFGLSAEDFDA